MAYKKDQGRYARMFAFWALFLLLAYGIIRPAGLVLNLRSWIRSLAGEEAASPWIEPFPILGKFDLAMLIALVLLAIGGFAIHLWLSRPKIADMLIETESELRKVTWPSMEDTWKGTIAVVVTVAFLLVYLTTVDLAINFLVNQLLQGAS